MGYTKAAITGFSWQTALKIATAGLSLLKVATLARLLSPSQFGQFSLVTIALGLSEAVTETGINVTIIQSKRSVEYFLNTAWVVAICRGLLIGSLMVLLGIVMSGYYDDSSLSPLIALAAMVPIVKGFINPAIVSLHKDLRFFADSTYRLSLVIVDLILAILLTFWFPTVVSLIVALVGTALFEVSISLFFFKTRPRFAVIPSRVKEILHNSKGLSIAAALQYINENVDNLLIGKLLGTFNLGLYHNGYRLAHKPNTDAATAASHGVFPVYTKIAQDNKRLVRAFSRSTTAVFILATIATLPLILAPEFFVQIVLGDQWLAITPAVPWLAGAGLVHTFTTLSYTLLLTKKDYRLLNTHQLGTAIATIISLLALTQSWNLLGAGIAIFFARLSMLPILGYALYKHLFREQ